MVLSRLTKITGPGVATDTNWVGNNADFTGITTTATSFNIGVTTIHSTLIESHNIVSTGIITATGAHFSGNVSIAGTFTYEDVTNVDSIGIITARSQLNVGNNIKLGNAGVITATSFVGDGSGLIGVASTDNIITGTAATFTGGVDINSDLDVDGHTNLDNVSVAGVSTFTDDVYFDGATAGRDIVFDRSDNQLEFAPNAKAYFGGAYPLTIYNNINSYISQNPNAALFIESKDVQIYGSGNGYNNAIFIARNGIVELGYEPSGGSLSTQLKTSAKGVTVGTGVTIETNGQATFSGIVTASTFYGDGSNLSNITSTTINNNADNRIITGSGTANTLEGESTLTYDNGGLNIAGNSSRDGLKITNTGDHLGEICVTANRSSANSALMVIRGEWNNTEVASIYLSAGSDTSNKDDGQIKFYTSPDSGTGIQNRLTITSDGKLGVGIDTPSEIFHIRKNDTTGPTITLQNNANKAYINNWGSAGGGSGRTNRFEINATLQAQASYCAPYHTFMTGGVGDSYEKVRIDSSGNFIIGATSASGILHVEHSGENNSYIIGNTTTSGARIILQNKNATANSFTGVLGADAGGQTTAQVLFYSADNDNNEGYMTFETRPSGGIPTERMRIYSTGRILIGNGGVEQSPSGNLDIVGDINGNGGELYLRVSNNNVADNIGALLFGNNVDKSIVKIQGVTHTANNTGDIAFHTSTTGTMSEKARITSDGHVVPSNDATQDIGTSLKRWRNVYTTDLQLSNVGEGGNEVDGTEGKWTLQEGESHIYMINRKTGKKYEMMLKEVD